MELLCGHFLHFSCVFCAQTIFIGHGPNFKFQKRVPEFENIELYNIMCGEDDFLFCFAAQLFSEIQIITERLLLLSSVLSSSDLLGLKPAPNNGTHGSLNDMLKDPPHQPSMPEEVTPPSLASDSEVAVTHDLGCSCDDEVSAGL